MYYKVIEALGPETEDSWSSYIEWRKLELERFESVDGMLRPDYFEPESDEDWENCVNADYKLNLITDIDYAILVMKRYAGSILVGVDIELERDVDNKDGLLGFDIMDEYCCTSLLTNWGNDTSFINIAISKNGLLDSFEKALEIRDRLRDKFNEDSHACNCSIWAVYSINHITNC